MREASTELIYQLAQDDKRVMAVTADGRNGVWDRIKVELPSQYVDYGISEQNMVASAAGLASRGKIPFVFGTSTFLGMRAFEFIRNDISIPNMNVKFLGIFSGLSRPSWGATHQGTEELALLRCLPNIQVITPSTPIQAREATRYAYEHNGPVYIRLEASGETEYYKEDYRYVFGRAERIINHLNRVDLTIISTGAILDLAIEVADELINDDYIVEVIDMPTIKPIDKNVMLDIVDTSSGVITLEEHSIYGGLGSAVAEVIAESGKMVRFKRLGLNGCTEICGSRESLRKDSGISKEDIIHVCRMFCCQ